MEEASGPPLEIWPDNAATVNAFIAMGTQWRTGGMAGLPSGLDYAALPAVLRLTGIKRAEWPEVFEGLRVMEDVALETIRKQQTTR